MGDSYLSLRTKVKHVARLTEVWTPSLTKNGREVVSVGATGFELATLSQQYAFPAVVIGKGQMAKRRRSDLF
jgi:hypothetical protein